MNHEFWIDRGGTFTDVCVPLPDGGRETFKYLSENPDEYPDAALHAIRRYLQIHDETQPTPEGAVDGVYIGTTVATNALLERKGARVGLLITSGFRDLLDIAYQDRPELFALEIVKPSSLAAEIAEVDERILADGTVRSPLDEPGAQRALTQFHSANIDSLAVVLVNSYANPEHELLVERLAAPFGFRNISLSHRVANEIKAVPRGDTTLVDAYLTPVIRDYVATLRAALGASVRLKFMQSSGGLVDAERFQGKDAILSGPAGGVVACRELLRRTRFKKLIAFDMGGTSTDVSRIDEHADLTFDKPVAGCRVRAPMFRIETVAAGGGSILSFRDGRFVVGPESAGANPGPACYGRGGPATITDANVVLGRVRLWSIQALAGGEEIATIAARKAIAALADQIAHETGTAMSVEEVAMGFVSVADENMARPIKEIAVAQGIDLREYALACFGSAGPQHACGVADALGIRDVLVPREAAVFSAYGVGIADAEYSQVEPVLATLSGRPASSLNRRFEEMEQDGQQALREQGVPVERIHHRRSLEMRYTGTDATLSIAVPAANPREVFETEYRRLHGYAMPDANVEIVNARVVSIGKRQSAVIDPANLGVAPANPCADSPSPNNLHEGDLRKAVVEPTGQTAQAFFKESDNAGKRILVERETPVCSGIPREQSVHGPSLIGSHDTTIVLEPGWRAEYRDENRSAYTHLHRDRDAAREWADAACDPVLLEIFNSAFASIAEQMGNMLERVAHSVNIKERLDFSCAVFDAAGGLVANAQHIPVHLGAMGESVKAVLAAHGDAMRSGDVYATNDPYAGGSHLPDVTVVTPVFDEDGRRIFIVANRGHHADIGGIAPGSMPPFSKSLDEEGVVLRNVLLVREGVFREKEIAALLTEGTYPARNLAERLSDLRAQIAANTQGVDLLRELREKYSIDVVHAYMGHVRANAAACMRAAIAALPGGEHRFEDTMDCGARIACTVTIAGDHATVDFAGTDAQLDSNLNAPPAVTIAAVLYVFRTLIAKPIPLNSGCLEPIEIRIPEGSLLNPRYPAAVVGGNVETSQRICDVLYGALGVLAAGQGTMNNFLFGNDRFGYYETICGGAGAGDGFHGASGVHVHMTNTRITDPEVLERRYPVVVREFTIRRGSGGAGKWRGGDGVRRSIEFLEPMQVSLLTERRTTAPFGLRGGAPGAPGQNRLIRNGVTTELPGHATIHVEPGDVLTIETPGGGGFGVE